MKSPPDSGELQLWGGSARDLQWHTSLCVLEIRLLTGHFDLQWCLGTDDNSSFTIAIIAFSCDAK